MNLPQIYRVLTSQLPNLSIKYYEYEEKEQAYDYIFTDIDLYKSAYYAVISFAPFLLDRVTADFLEPIIKRGSQYSTLTTNKEVGKGIISGANHLKESVDRYVSYIEPFALNNAEEDSIDVKFIHISDLDELEKTINQLKRALNAPVFELDGRVEIQQVNSGSILITLVIIGAFANQIVRMVANLIWAAVAIKNKAHQSQVFIEHGRTLELKNDMLELIKEQAKHSLEKGKESEAQHIINEFLPEKNSPENLVNFKASIDMFDALLEKGAEFYPSIKAAEEVKQLFPDFNALNLIESKIKMLDEGKDKS